MNTRTIAAALCTPGASTVAGAALGVIGAVLAILVLMLFDIYSVFPRFLAATIGGGLFAVGYWEWIIPKLRRFSTR